MSAIWLLNSGQSCKEVINFPHWNSWIYSLQVEANPVEMCSHCSHSVVMVNSWDGGMVKYTPVQVHNFCPSTLGSGYCSVLQPHDLFQTHVLNGHALLYLSCMNHTLWFNLFSYIPYNIINLNMYFELDNDDMESSKCNITFNIIYYCSYYYYFWLFSHLITL